MGYKAFATMNVAIIGNEKMTGVLAQGLALAGHEVFIGIKKNQSILLDFLAAEFDNLSVVTIEEAAAMKIASTATQSEDYAELSRHIRSHYYSLHQRRYVVSIKPTGSSVSLGLIFLSVRL